MMYGSSSILQPHKMVDREFAKGIATSPPPRQVVAKPHLTPHCTPTQVGLFKLPTTWKKNYCKYFNIFRIANGFIVVLISYQTKHISEKKN